MSLGNNNGLLNLVFVRRMPATIVWGGLEKLMAEWFERIDYSKCKVTLVVSPGGADVYAQHLKGLPIDIIDFDFNFTAPFLTRFSKCSSLFKRLKPSKVIFFQGQMFCFDFAQVLAANLSSGGEVYMHENLGAPVQHAKTSAISLWWHSERFFSRMRAVFSKRVMTVSAEIRQRLISLWSYPPDKVHVQYHGVDLVQFSPSLEVRSQMRQKLGIKEADPVIIVTARLSQEKCIHRVIEAFDLLSREHKDLRVLIAGSGPLEDKLKEQARAIPVTDRIVFLGHVSDVPQYLKMGDIYVLSSDNEGLSLALLEAMSSGLLCVVTDCTGTGEVITDGRNGFRVSRSSDAVRAGIDRALKLSPAEKAAMLKESMSFVTANFEINARVKNALNIIGIPC